MHLLGGDCMSDKKEKFLTRNYILMLLLNCIYGVSQNFITTPLAKQGVAIGLSMTTIGTIASAVTIIAMICRPIFGNFMDRINIKKVLYLALGCLFLSFALIGLGSNNNAVFYTVGRLVYGAGFSFRIQDSDCLWHQRFLDGSHDSKNIYPEYFYVAD